MAQAMVPTMAQSSLGNSSMMAGSALASSAMAGNTTVGNAMVGTQAAPYTTKFNGADRLKRLTKELNDKDMAGCQVSTAESSPLRVRAQGTSGSTFERVSYTHAQAYKKALSGQGKKFASAAVNGRSGKLQGSVSSASE